MSLKSGTARSSGLVHPSKSESSVDAEDNATTSRRIHVLGVGNIGLLFAHSLGKLHDPPPITLLLHRANLACEWEESGRTVEVITHGRSERDGDFDVQVIKATEDESMLENKDIIENLILATKTINTVAALSAIKDRLTRSSTILFAQNGMGTVEEVNEKVFVDPSSRPNYLSCIVSHGAFTQGPFRLVHAGFGTVAIGQVYTPHDHGESIALDSDRLTSKPRYLLEMVTKAPILVATEYDPVELSRLRLEKLVVNAIVNPLTVIFNCRNGEVLSNNDRRQLMRRLLAETSQVIRSLPELKSDKATEDRFSTQKLETVVLDVADKTGQNTSSMLQDVRASRPTEIDYINGYIVKRGKEVGLECTNTKRLIQMVKEACSISDEGIYQYFPDN